MGKAHNFEQVGIAACAAEVANAMGILKSVIVGISVLDVGELLFVCVCYVGNIEGSQKDT